MFTAKAKAEAEAAKVKAEKEKRYYISDDNEECPVPITDSEECVKAAVALGGEFDGPRDWTDRCPGCLITPSDSPPQFNFNRETTGKCQNKDQRPVCKVETSMALAKDKASDEKKAAEAAARAKRLEAETAKKESRRRKESSRSSSESRTTGSRSSKKESRRRKENSRSRISIVTGGQVEK